MKNKITQYSLLGSVLIFGFLSWLFVYRAIKIPDSSTWLLPMIFFSLYAISLCLAAVIAKEEMEFNSATAISMLFSLIFARFAWHFGILLFCVLLMLWGFRNIRNDLGLNVKISLLKSLGTGKFKVVLALAILVSSQYFFITKEMDGQKNFPKFDVSAVSSKMVKPVLEMMNPNFKKIQQDGLTVDQFIIESQKQNMKSEQSFNEELIDQQIPQNLPAKQREALKQQVKEQLEEQQTQLSEKNNKLVLQEGRRQLSEMVGKDLSGDEKFSDVFSGLIDKKINDFFRYKIDDESQPYLLEYIFTAILFLTVWPLGSILCSLCFLLVAAIFKLFIFFGLVRVDKIMVEREMIV